MSLLGLFTKNNKTSKEASEILKLNDKISNLLSANKYISKKEYLQIIDSYNDIISFFQDIDKSGLLRKYCKTNNVKLDVVKDTITNFKTIEKLVDVHNNEFINEKLISEKEYLDKILKEVDPNILLDKEQRKVVLSDEDYTLVIAGAGSGKTTTMAAKVKYLVEKLNIKPEEILMVSYTNKAVSELKEKINKDLKLNVPISTFHSVGNAILHKNDDKLKKIVDSNRIYYVIQDYFKKEIMKNPSLMKKLILFFSTYFEFPSNYKDIDDLLDNLSKSTYSTMKSDLKDYCKQILDKRTKQKKTIQLELLKSKEEVQIANFLYMNNIEYEYEPVYKYNINFSNKPYTPDFIIKQKDNIAYIEHFGIDENGENDRYTFEQLKKYKKAINDKIKIHKIHKTKLLYTFSKYNDGNYFINHLKEQLINNGFTLSPKNEEEVLKKIISDEENKYITKLLTLITRFIQLFKVNGYDEDEFDTFYQKSKNERTKLFLTICKECYFEYQKYLTNNNAIDFDDMINNSKKILKDVKEVGEKINFKYIIVDEYQDISMQRFDLVKALHEVCDAKIIAVGDDFQAIFAFAGSDIKLFTDFREKFGYANINRIVNTYRNSQELIDIAGNFVEKNKLQIYKELKSNKHIKYPIVVNCYDKSDKILENLASAVELALDNIVKTTGPNSKVLLLGRFGFDGFNLGRSDKFRFVDYGSKVISEKYPSLKITFMTAHASKGLGFDNVIIINAKNGMYGFPSKIENDPILSLVIKEDRSYEYAEERRLFYVALTRTKNRVFIITPSEYPSDFLIEILNDYSNIKVNGKLNINTKIKKQTYKKCPICGYPMQFRYKESFGLPLFICMNDSELCGYMINEYSASYLEVIKCDKCIDGYLIAKKGKDNEYFLGCTNYKKDGTGCNRTMSKKDFDNKYTKK